MKRIPLAAIALLVAVVATCTLVPVANAAVSASPVSTVSSDLCPGGRVQRLGGSHAVTRQPIVDAANLRQRLPELEASIRTVIAKDPTLGPAVADALIAAIRDGSGITERPMQRDEAVHWMAYQSKPGTIDAIAPVCLRLERAYEAFEITVETLDPAQVAQAPNCAIVATRSCTEASPTFAVSTRGSSPGARVTMAAGDRPVAAVGGPAESWTVEDPGPYELDATFTVKAQGSPAPARTARVFRFLMPKVCGNLAYLGEAERKTIGAAGPAATCEKSVRVERCAPVVAPPAPQAVVADLCEEDRWALRTFLFGYFPTGGELERDILLSTGPARESFEIDDGYGVGVAVERRLGPVLGLEGAALFGRGETSYELDNGSAVGEDSHNANFFAFTFGPNFHLLGCGGVDLYVGPFLGYGGFADPNYWVFDHHFAASLDGRFIWGGQIGLDVPFGASRWGFHGGMRYLDLSQDTDAGSIKVDPLIVEIGLAYRF